MHPQEVIFAESFGKFYFLKCESFYPDSAVLPSKIKEIIAYQKQISNVDILVG